MVTRPHTACPIKNQQLNDLVDYVVFGKSYLHGELLHTLAKLSCDPRFEAGKEGNDGDKLAPTVLYNLHLQRIW